MKMLSSGFPRKDQVSHVPNTIGIKRGETAPDDIKKARNISAELHSLVPMLSTLAGHKVELTLHVESSLIAQESSIACIEWNSLSHILINLVLNASEAMLARGSVKIWAGIQGLEGSGAGYLTLLVEDDGPAIPLTLLETIFEADPGNIQFKGQDTLSRAYRSRRFGLRGVKQVVEASKGRIRAIRLPERGSRFEVTLPIAKSA